MSHKIIEKRRRDRMNSQLADLSHLIPSNYLKKVISELNLSRKCLSKDFFFIQGRGRIEKTEIVEMAIKHIKHLHQLMETQRAAASASSSASCSNEESADAAAVAETKSSMTGSNWQCPQEVESFRNGFNECTAEAIHFLVDKESVPPGIINHIFKARRSKKIYISFIENQLCTRLVSHLKRYLEQKGHEPPPQQQQQQQPAEVVNVDSDYSSFRSEGSSATSSEVGSSVSQTSSGNVQMSQQSK